MDNAISTTTAYWKNAARNPRLICATNRHGDKFVAFRGDHAHPTDRTKFDALVRIKQVGNSGRAFVITNLDESQEIIFDVWSNSKVPAEFADLFTPTVRAIRVATTDETNAYWASVQAAKAVA